MMPDHVIVLSLNVLLWIYLVYRFVRAVQRRQITNGASLYAWSVFFLLYLVAALTVDEIEQAIDAHFNGLPVTLLIRSLLIFATAHLVYLAVGRVHHWLPRLRRFFLRFSIVMASALVIAFAVMASTTAFSITEMDFILKGIRDVLVIGWLVLMLAPPGIYVLQHEATRPARFRGGIVLACYAAALVQFVSELAWIFASMYGSPSAPILLDIERLSSYLCYLLFLAMLIPYKALMPFFYPHRMRRYLRLRQLAHALSPNSTQPSVRLNLTHPDDLETAIYNHVMEILDHYRELPEHQPLRARLQRIIESEHEYPDLVRQLASVRV